MVIKENKENEEIQDEKEQILVDIPDSETTSNEPDNSNEELEDNNPKKEHPEGSEDKSGNSKVDKSDFKPEFLQQYGNMSQEELLKQIREDQKFIGRRNQEIGELKKKAKTKEEKSSEDLKRHLRMKKEKLRKYKDRFSELDDDDEERSAIKKDIRKLEGEIDDTELAYRDKYMAERIYEEAAHDKNHELSQNMRKEYKDKYGLEFTDDEWKQFSEKTKASAKDYKLSPEDFDFSLMRGLGREKFMTLITTQAGINERQKMKKAALNSDIDIGGGARGGTKNVNLLELPVGEVKKLINKNPDIVDRLTVKQLDLLDKKLNA